MKKAQRMWSMVCLGLAVQVMAVEGAKFKEAPVGRASFRRDRLPLDECSIKGLSKQLLILARSKNLGLAGENRELAMVMAVACELDPGEKQASEMVGKMKAGEHRADVTEEVAEKSRKEIQRWIVWLDKPDAGEDGNRLSAYLQDILAVSGAESGGGGHVKEVGKWKGWLPEVKEYESEVVKEERVDEANVGVEKGSEKGMAEAGGVEEAGQVGKEGGETEKVVGEVFQPKVKEAGVSVVLWKEHAGAGPGERAWNFELGSMHMVMQELGEKGEGGELQLMIGTAEETRQFDKVRAVVLANLKKQQGKLPRGWVMSLSGDELASASAAKKRNSLSASAMVLANSVFSGEKPQAIVFGQIDEKGEYRSNSLLWDQIRACKGVKGKRMVFPQDSESYLQSILAMEQPEFFMENEVWLAKDVGELIRKSGELSGGGEDGAHKEYLGMVMKCGSTEVRQFITNRSVRKRLAEVSQEMPDLVSFRMLSIQAEGKRPTVVSRKVLASEIRAALQAYEWLMVEHREIADHEFVMLRNQNEQLRQSLEKLARYANSDDRELLKYGTDSVAAAKKLEQQKGVRIEEYKVKELIRSARQEFMSKNRVAMDRLSKEIEGA